MVVATVSEDDTLILAFATSTPISAAEVGTLLREMSADYKRATGGSLVLWRYETGSSWIFLRDAIAVAGSLAGSISNVSIAVQHMAKFVGYLRSYFDQSAKAEDSDAIDLVGKSAARIVKIAAESGADVTIQYSKDERQGTESYSFFLNHQRAKKLNVSTKSRKKLNRSIRGTTPVTSDASHLAQLTRQLTAEGGLSEDLVDILVLALKASGGDYILPSLISSLEAAGRFDIAEMVRKHIRGQQEETLRLPIR